METTSNEGECCQKLEQNPRHHLQEKTFQVVQGDIRMNVPFGGQFLYLSEVNYPSDDVVVAVLQVKNYRASTPPALPSMRCRHSAAKLQT